MLLFVIREARALACKSLVGDGLNACLCFITDKNNNYRKYVKGICHMFLDAPDGTEVMSSLTQKQYAQNKCATNFNQHLFSFLLSYSVHCQTQMNV